MRFPQENVDERGTVTERGLNRAAASAPPGESVWQKSLYQLHASRTVGPTLLAILVGFGSGLGAVIFRWLIRSAHQIGFSSAERWFDFLGPGYVIPVPALGGLLVGLLIYFGAQEARGHGVPEVMLAVATAGGRIRRRVAVIKSLASAICIGSGGSAGREGPIVQIGSSLGSTVGQLLRLPEERIKLLVACGAAGGIAATFNAPIAGVFFALEIILRNFRARAFGFVVLSSVAATAFSRATLGNIPAFRVPTYGLRSIAELPLYIVLGILAALISVLFIRALYAVEDLFDAWPLPAYVKPALGGLFVGFIGMEFPDIFGVGYETIERVLTSQMAFNICAALILLKLAATSLTIGSGGSGGIFSPSLFMGACLGWAFGDMAHHLFPNWTASPGAYALVGMGAVFGGAARAPVTAVIILFEMTADYRIIIPLMASVGLSTLVSERLCRESIYTLKLRRRGITIGVEEFTDPLMEVTVEQAMTREFPTVSASMPVAELANLLHQSGHHGYPVMDEEGGLMGIVTITDVERAAARGQYDKTVGDICTRDLIVCYPDESVSDALRRASPLELGHLPVVDRQQPRKLLGVLRRSDIVGAYARAVATRPAVSAGEDELPP